MIHLDTSFLIDLLREQQRREPGTATRLLQELAEEELAVSLFVLCELQAGAELAESPEVERKKVANLTAPLDLRLPDRRLSNTYGRLFADLSRRGARISALDLLIASAALNDSARLVTANVKHFSRVPELGLISY